MQLDYVDRFIALVFAGGGLFLAGVINLCLTHLGVRLRAGLTAAVCAVAVGGVALWVTDPLTARLTAAVVVAGVGLTLVLSPGALRAIARGVEATVGRAGVRWGLLAAAGLALIASASATYDQDDRAWINQDSGVVDGQYEHPPHADVADVRLTTDRGTPIPLTACATPRAAADLKEIEERSLRSTGHAHHVIRLRPADDLSNCFGWVFAAGQYAIHGSHVETILAENGYEPVADPRPGDLVVYRNPNGQPEHVAIVRYVAENGPPLVESKWGWDGVYLHAVQHTLYGDDRTFYRSPRNGHRLRSSGGDPADGAAATLK